MNTKKWILGASMSVLLAGAVFGASPATSQGMNWEEITSYSGLKFSFNSSSGFEMDPKFPFVQCEALELPIPIYADLDGFEFITFGSFKTSKLADDEEQLSDFTKNNAASKLQDPLSDTRPVGVQLKIKNQVPASLSLPALLPPSVMKSLKGWCSQSGEDIRVIKFTIVFERSDGTEMHLDPGIGVRRGG